jgi:hypothetical protein
VERRRRLWRRGAMRGGGELALTACLTYMRIEQGSTAGTFLGELLRIDV